MARARHQHAHGEGDDHGSAADGLCAHAAARSADAPAALAAADAACRARGVRLTPIRRDVLAALYATHRPLGAYDVIEAMAGPQRRRMAPISIYRALDFLIDQGLVHRLASRNAFVACPHGHDDPVESVAFLICDVCGGVDEIASPDLARALGRIFAEQAFQPGRPVVEIAGRCAHCQAA
jgi:Fur family zinc uptake transcriptional regulator